ncbi:MAG: hypothetical protein FWF86_05310 [Clostridia bacterium]|nr:hypothetical protein [Clostridia bacterium]
MDPNQNTPEKIIRIGGREFRLYRYLDESLGEELINYPDFQKSPAYTDDGRPFVLAVQECCPDRKSDDPENSDPGDCSGCAWFYLEKPADAIGLCMCDKRRRGPARSLDP